MWYWHYGFGLGFLEVIFWIIVFWLLFRLTRGHYMHVSGCDVAGMKESDSAMRILRERFAKGEINKDEFEEKRKELEK